MPYTFFAALSLILFVSILLALLWSRQLGVIRACLSASCRFAWVFPILFALFPKTTTEELPRSISSQQIHVLLDDSDSMQKWSGLQSPLTKAMENIKDLEQECARLGCELKVHKLSEINPLTKEGYTPLSLSVHQWLSQTNEDPWILLSDGGDFQPSIPWNQSVKNLGLAPDNHTKKRGMVVSFSNQNKANIWIESVDLPPFAFESKPVFSEIMLQRTKAITGPERLQVQVILNDQILASDNATFAAGQTQSRISLPIPSLPRGKHLVSFKILPSAKEEIFWDNEAHTHIEVMPNTVGVLHLLGSPSWDGRFLRRFLKSEPKYDLISFYILRDPWDTQGSNERELSLIPFPVSRLFNEELPNFRVIILQNFTLLQFLMPQYQKNLVKFVKDGGGLLFLGGHRALLDADMRNSPLKEILPFTLTSKAKGKNRFFSTLINDMNPDRVDKSGPWYDSKLAYKISLAKPNWEKRALANVYDDWEALKGPLTNMNGAVGLHHMENVKFKQDSYTPLLFAESDDGVKRPLAIASYPGKGRAIWLFSDSMWKLALKPSHDISREIYNDFLQSAMTWLLRQDLKKPLMINQFKLNRTKDQKISWTAILEGPVVSYFDAASNWSLNIYGKQTPFDRIDSERLGNQHIKISGLLDLGLNGGERCPFSIQGVHPAFGSVKASTAAVFPAIFKDFEIVSAPNKLEQLATITRAEFVDHNKQPTQAIYKWLDQINSQEGISLPQRFRSKLDYYWFVDTYWIFLFIIFLPLEILIRRWHNLVAS
ncbi:MAG: hypothetical protein HRU09_10970 [Oligoflexales bacterium]|nr:hypothetical protein [Oligoflexales bacterium]